jgi:hypothetical protein
MGELRRLLPRQLTDWRGKCLFEDESDQRWRDCRVLDVSSAGAAVELLDMRPGQVVGTRMLLAVHLRGELRHAQGTDAGRLRAGIQFVDLSESERHYLESLAELQATW